MHRVSRLLVSRSVSLYSSVAATAPSSTVASSSSASFSDETIARVLRVNGTPYREVTPINNPLSKRQTRMHEKLPVPEQGQWTVDSFLQAIGRDCDQVADVFVGDSEEDRWQALFQARGPELEQLGVKKARQRRWILRWAENFRHGVDPRSATSIKKSKARKNNPGMEKRKRGKYPGWAEYMYPGRSAVDESISQRKDRASNSQTRFV